MRIEKVVANASPLIIFFKSGLADLLPALFTDSGAEWGLGRGNCGWIIRLRGHSVARDILAKRRGLIPSVSIAVQQVRDAFVAFG